MLRARGAGLSRPAGSVPGGGRLRFGRPAASSGWASSSAPNLAMASVPTASTVGTSPAIRNAGAMPIASPTGPAIAMETGISASETKKSRLDTRPSRAGGTRRCSRVPQTHLRRRRT